MTRLSVATATTPGAVALLQLYGPEAQHRLAELTGRADWPAGRIRLCAFADIDEGLAVVLEPGDGPDTGFAQLMPHGGPRVVQKLVDHLIALGCVYDPDPDPRVIYPEADTAVEADMLDTLARAASPAAIDLLAAQPARWRALLALPEADRAAQCGRIAERSRVLDLLVTPPTVVVAGEPNVGKSTLTNALSGRAISIVADLPGTTRDWVGGRVEMVGGVAVRWLDTPGLRVSDDAVEQHAIALARPVVDKAHVLIAMRDGQTDWPEADALPRTPDLWVVNKCDHPAASDSTAKGDAPDSPLCISAEYGHGVLALQKQVLARLGLDVVDVPAPWAFSPALRAWAEGETIDLAAYLST